MTTIQVPMKFQSETTPTLSQPLIDSELDVEETVRRWGRSPRVAAPG